MSPVRTSTRHPRRFLRASGIAAALVVAAFSAALAHDTWLAPLKAAVAVGDTMHFDLSSGGAFPELESAIDRSRIQVGKLRLAGTEARLTPARDTKDALKLHAVAKRAGVATVWISLAPKTLTLEPDKIEEYYGDIDAPAAVRAHWSGLPKGTVWTESYAKHAKTFVRVGDAGSDTSWKVPVGMGLEVVPETNPTTLRVGGTFAVRLLKNGKPLAGLPLGAEYEGGNAVQQWHVTDAAGRATFTLGAPGRWLLHTTELRPATRAGLVWESDFSTLTVTVSK